MAATDVLETIAVEHGMLADMLDWLGRRAAATPPPGGSRDMCAMAAHVLGSHFRLEEELLLEAVEPRLPAGEPPATAALRAEHRRILDLFRHAADSQQVRSGTVTDAIAALRLHLRREEETLLPLARRTLSSGYLDRLAFSWAEMREMREAAPQD